MKNFVLNIILFFFIVELADICIGIITDYMIEQSKGGVTKQMYDLCYKDNHDVLIMGSSRAHHHYVPDIIEDSLNCTAYNAGYDGNGIILHYGIYKMITKRYTPKVIIYDVYKPFDIYEYKEDVNNTRYIQNLRKYYRDEDVKEIIHSVNDKYRLQMVSNLYRLNGSMISILCDFILKRPTDKKGYAPLYGEYKGNGNKQQEKKEKEKTDSLKLHYLEKLMVDTQKDGVKLIIAMSPLYNGLDVREYQSVIEMCKKYNVALLDFSNEETLVKKNLLWKEPVHLNHEGAKVYTEKLIVPELKKIL